MGKLKVEIVYRNYIPLYNQYASFFSHPPEGVEFWAKPPKPVLKRLYPLYRTFGNLPGVRNAVNMISPLLFRESSSVSDDSAFLTDEAFFYVGMLPSKRPDRVFFIDLEHVYALLNFVPPDDLDKARDQLLRTLADERCLGAVPWSGAAARTVESFLGESYKGISNKVQVLYPTLPCLAEKFESPIAAKLGPVNELKIRDPESLNLLFVGKDCLRKGITELLEAFSALKNAGHVHLWVIADLEGDILRDNARNKNIHFLKPSFNLESLVSQFFAPCDLFVLPTHADTFGMVFLESLSSGTPIISTRQFAGPEIVRHGKNGFLLDHPPLFLDSALFPEARHGKGYLLDSETSRALTEDLHATLKNAIEHPQIVRGMRAECLADFAPGAKFSVERRNSVLQRLITLSA